MLTRWGLAAYLKSWIDGQSHDDKAFILNALTKQSVRANKNKRKGHAEDQVGHGCGGGWFTTSLSLLSPATDSIVDPEYNSFLSPEKVSAFAQQHVPGASGVIGGFHNAQNTFSNAQHTMGFREMNDDNAPPGTYMPGSSPRLHSRVIH